MDQASCAFCQNPRPEPGQTGVLGLLEGKRMWIEPAGFEEIHARGNLEAHRLQAAHKWVPYGVGAIEGESRAPLPVLLEGDGDLLLDSERAATETNAGVVEPGDLQTAERRAAQEAPRYGPGEEPRPPDGMPTGSAHGELL